MTSRKITPVALMDLDGTLADYDAALSKDMDAISGPDEERFDILMHDKQPKYIRARMHLIKDNPNWWANLDEIPTGFKIYKLLLKLNFRIVVLTQGPTRNAEAWKGKLIWCRKHLKPDTDVIITRDKGLVYGKILVDDFPPYVESWLEHRPRGLVIMPDQPWNQGYKHDQVFRYTDGNRVEHAALEATIKVVLKDFKKESREERKRSWELVRFNGMR